MIGVDERSIVIGVCACSEGMRRIVVIKDGIFIGDFGVEMEGVSWCRHNFDVGSWR